MLYDAIISSEHEDREFGIRLSGWLEAEEFLVWLDKEGVLAGPALQETIRQALWSSKADRVHAQRGQESLALLRPRSRRSFQMGAKAPSLEALQFDKVTPASHRSRGFSLLDRRCGHADLKALCFLNVNRGSL